MRRARRSRGRHVSRRAHHVAADRAGDHRRTRGPASTIARTTTTKDLIVRVDHAALPHRGRRGRGADHGAQLRAGRADGVGDRRRRPASSAGRRRDQRQRRTLASGAERRDDWRFLPRRLDRQRSPRRRRPRATSTPWSCRSRSALRHSPRVRHQRLDRRRRRRHRRQSTCRRRRILPARIDRACRWRRRWPDRCLARSTS